MCLHPRHGTLSLGFLRCKPRERATQRTSSFLHIWFLLCGSMISGKRGLDCSYIHVMERKSPAHPHMHLHVIVIKEDSIASICVCAWPCCAICVSLCDVCVCTCKICVIYTVYAQHVYVYVCITKSICLFTLILLDDLHGHNFKNTAQER